MYAASTYQLLLLRSLLQHSWRPQPQFYSKSTFKIRRKNREHWFEQYQSNVLNKIIASLCAIIRVIQHFFLKITRIQFRFPQVSSVAQILGSCTKVLSTFATVLWQGFNLYLTPARLNITTACMCSKALSLLLLISTDPSWLKIYTQT